MTRRSALLWRLCSLALVWLCAAGSATAQSVQVSAANPPAGEQDTVSLIVKITGKNFAKGARSEFFKSGTTDPSGITVRGTQFVSSTEVDATIDIAAAASVSYFDIKVSNTNGRSGKGSDLFQVVQKGAVVGCTLEPAGPNFGLVQELNPGGLLYPTLVNGGLGRATISAAGGPSNTVLLAILGTNSNVSKMEVFALNATTGALLDGSPLCAGCAAQPHVTLAIPNDPDGSAGGAKYVALGNLNGDGVPDFAVSQPNGASLFVSTISATGVIGWTAIPVPGPLVVTNFGWGVALGDLDLDGRDELAVSQVASGTGKAMQPGVVYLYRYFNGGLTQIDAITQASVTPSVTANDYFGYAVAIGDITGDGHGDLVVGVPYRSVNGVGGAGSAFVFETVPANNANGFSIVRTAKVMSSSSPGKNANFGRTVTVAQVDGSAAGRPDLIVTTGWGNTSSTDGEVFSSPVSNGQASILPFKPRAGLDNGWGTTGPSIGDVNGDGLADILIGAPNADNGGNCNSPGMVYLYLANGPSGGPTTGWTRLSLQAPTATSGFGAFGWSVMLLDGSPFLIVVETGRSQEYLYQFLP